MARRLLFATTNHIERLDPALSRPGRIDVWANFKHATKWQAEGIFKCFFPSKHSAPPANPVDKDKGKDNAKADANTSNMAESKRERATRTHAIPLLSEEEISDLARRFADAIPENELSVRLVYFCVGHAQSFADSRAFFPPFARAWITFATRF